MFLLCADLNIFLKSLFGALFLKKKLNRLLKRVQVICL